MDIIVRKFAPTTTELIRAVVGTVLNFPTNFPEFAGLSKDRKLNCYSVPGKKSMDKLLKVPIIDVSLR